MNFINKIGRNGAFLAMHCLLAAKLEAAIIVLTVVTKIGCPKAIVYSLYVFIALTGIGLIMVFISKAVLKIKKLTPLILTIMSQI